jgi:hypothetical protein
MGHVMKFLERLFPGKEVREALQEINKLDQSLPEGLGEQLGFHAIKTKLRQVLVRDPERLRAETDQRSIGTVVLIVARNIVWEELASGDHMLWGTRTTMTGNGLVSLFHYLSSSLEKAGIEPAKDAERELREMIEQRFGE